MVDVHNEAWLKVNHPESTRGDTQQTLNNPLPSVGTSLPLSHSPSVALSNIPATLQRSPQISLGDATVSLSPHVHQSPTVISNNKSGTMQQSLLSELLNVPVSDKPKKNVATGKAHVLTSAECLKVLVDKENEKNKRQKKRNKEKNNDY